MGTYLVKQKQNYVHGPHPLFTDQNHDYSIYIKPHYLKIKIFSTAENTMASVMNQKR